MALKAKFAGTCAVTGKSYKAGTLIEKTAAGWAIVSSAQAASTPVPILRKGRTFDGKIVERDLNLPLFCGPCVKAAGVDPKSVTTVDDPRVQSFRLTRDGDTFRCPVCDQVRFTLVSELTAYQETVLPHLHVTDLYELSHRIPDTEWAKISRYMEKISYADLADHYDEMDEFDKANELEGRRGVTYTVRDVTAVEDALGIVPQMRKAYRDEEARKAAEVARAKQVEQRRRDTERAAEESAAAVALAAWWNEHLSPLTQTEVYPLRLNDLPWQMVDKALVPRITARIASELRRALSITVLPESNIETCVVDGQTVYRNESQVYAPDSLAQLWYNETWVALLGACPSEYHPRLATELLSVIGASYGSDAQLARWLGTERLQAIEAEAPLPPQKHLPFGDPHESRQRHEAIRRLPNPPAGYQIFISQADDGSRWVHWSVLLPGFGSRSTFAVTVYELLSATMQRPAVNEVEYHFTGRTYDVAAAIRAGRDLSSPKQSYELDKDEWADNGKFHWLPDERIVLRLTRTVDGQQQAREEDVTDAVRAWARGEKTPDVARGLQLVEAYKQAKQRDKDRKWLRKTTGIADAEAITSRQTLAEDEDKGYSSGSYRKLEKVTLKRAGDIETLCYFVTRGWWSMGEDGDADESVRAHNDEAKARAAYEEGNQN